MNGYLAGAIEEAVFQAKAADLKVEVARVEEALACANVCDPDAPVRALALFDFSQNLVDVWHRSNSEEKRQVLDCVSLNRTVTATTLCVTKRKPFDYIAERPFLKNGRGASTDFEPAASIEPFASPFLGPVEPVFLEAERLVRRVA